MNVPSFIAAIFITLFTAGLCSADTLVITYRSGKTQTVTLDEPSTSINSWQFVAGPTAAAPVQPILQPQAAPQEAPKPAEVKAEQKPAPKPAEKKSGLRFNWNAKPITD